ncbi:hypothetical protein EYS14_03430 [Alteromonadaceae bacterium M269]|nr:hypothetical protein EYS14_03430 [Alteromonadaceae bacterium M269]
MDQTFLYALTGLSTLLAVIAAYLIKPVNEKAVRALHKAELAEKELAAYKLHVAENFVSQSQLDRHMERFDKSLDEIKEMIAKLGN